MKTLRIALIAFVTLFVFASCKKETDDIVPANLPAPSAELAGNYVVTQYRLNNEPLQNLPSSRRIEILIGYIADDQAHLLFNETNNGQNSVDDYGNFDVKRVGRTIDVYDGASKIASYNNGTLEVQFEQSNGTVHFFAKRR